MNTDVDYTPVTNTFYVYDVKLEPELGQLRQNVNVLRTLVKTISPESIQRIREYFRLKNIYNSNAIEGNTLSMGETKLVIQEGLTITGKPLKDTLEAKNLSSALDFFEELADRNGEPITIQDVRNIHTHILRGIDDSNAGNYRSVFVKISGSDFRPPDPAQVPQMMNELGKWLEQISDKNNEMFNRYDPIVVACVAHAWFVYIHPFIDGNGRTARLLMNLLLLRHGYPLTILTKDDRQRYYDALEESQASNLTPFIQLVLESALESFEVYEQAARDQLDLQQLVSSVVSEQENRLRNDYDVFASAMTLLKGYFRQAVQMFEDEANLRNLSDRVRFKDFGILEFEKYQSLRNTKSAKQTWFFRLTFYRDQKPTRYLFFFGFASDQIKNVVGDREVTLHIATEVEPYFYERLSTLPSAGLPSMLELGYLPDKEKFVYLDRSGQSHTAKAEEIAREFIRQPFENLH